MSPHAPTRFGVIVPVGASALDVWRGVELVKSLLYWEPQVSAIVFIEDAEAPRGLDKLSVLPTTCRVGSIAGVLGGRGSWQRGHSWLGVLTAGILKALAWIHERISTDFVLRIDSDALVIASFAETVRKRLAQRPETGVLGVLGMSCNPRIRALQDLHAESRLCRAWRLFPSARAHASKPPEAKVDVEWFGRVSCVHLAAFDCLRPDLGAAMQNGYWENDYCQGGACVVSRAMLDRMTARDYLRGPDLWHGLPFPDDVVLAMYAYAVGLRVCDFSAPGEPFGVQHRGLPYPPVELIGRRHSLIHSVRNDRRFSEHAIRRFFQEQRSNR